MQLKINALLILITMSVIPAQAGLKWADVGVDGLTCSMCSRSVEMSLRRLDFVDKVVMSLEATEGRIFFKPDMPIDLNAIAKAVVNAGFSVRFLKLQISFDDIPLNDDGSFVFQNQKFKWIDFQDRINEPVTLKLVAGNFLPKKESAEWKREIGTSKSGDQNILHVIQQR